MIDLDARFKEKHKELFCESKCVRLSLTRGQSDGGPTVTFKGEPLHYAKNGFVNTYLKNAE